MSFLLGRFIGSARAPSGGLGAPHAQPPLFLPSQGYDNFAMTEGPARKYDFDGAQVEPVRTAASFPGRKVTANSRMATATQFSQGAACNVVVISENRAREIGVAICNIRALHTIELVQFNDNHSFSQALALLQVSALQLMRILSF